MSLLGLLKKEQNLPKIKFGLHNNCVLLAVSNEVRKKQDKSIINRNTFTKFGQLDENGTVVASTEVSWFNIDSGKDYAYDNFFTQVDQMTGIIDVLIPPTEEEDKWEDIFSAILAAMEIEETKEGIAAALKNKKKTVELMNTISGAYVKMLTPLVGEDSTVMKLKLTYDRNGKFLQQPKYDPFVEPLEYTGLPEKALKITPTELSYEAKSRNLAPAATPNVSDDEI
jgi:hypothetical protein